MTATENSAKLRSLLEQDAKVHPDISAFILGQLGIESISDFASIMTKDDYQQSVQDLILDKVPSQKSSLVMKARLRTAWQLCQADLDYCVKRKSESQAPEELEAILDPVVKKTGQRLPEEARVYLRA